MIDFMVVGLGNPGSEHAEQRHNAGYRCVGRLAKRHRVAMKASKLASTGKAVIDGSEVLLVQPRTWYNGTGRAVASLMQRENLPIERVIAVYDDLDLPEGRLRMRAKGSDGGNNGLKSIIAETGSGNFGRIRIGIGRPWVNKMPSWDPEVIIRYVLAMPPKDSREVLEAAIERACDAIEAVVREGWDRAMNVYNADAREPGEANQAPLKNAPWNLPSQPE
jgi:PTH1 family peptidyl-tRNA hydrolase